jgi:hypothetical protein
MNVQLQIDWDGRVLAHCFAGCAPAAILGLRMADLVAGPPPPELGRVVRSWTMIRERDLQAFITKCNPASLEAL